MKYTNLLLGLMLILMVAVGCKKNDSESPDAQQIVNEKISGTWTVSFAELDGNTLTDDFATFQITIDINLAFTTNSGTVNRQPNPWAESGSFALPDEVISTDNVDIIRNDGAVLSVVFMSETNIRIVFNFNDSNQGSNGRVNAVSGDWVFEFVKM